MTNEWETNKRIGRSSAKGQRPWLRETYWDWGKLRVIIWLAVLIGFCLSAGGMGWAGEEEIWLREAQEQAAARDYGAALDSIRIAREIAPESAECALWEGYILGRLERKEEAIVSQTEAISLEESDGQDQANFSGEAKSALMKLIYGREFPRWLKASSLAFLPLDFKNFSF